jgi:hypothetical protein
MAMAAGLGKLEGKHLDEFAQGFATAHELAGKLPKDLHWSEEIALQFRLPSPPEVRQP